MIRPATDTLRPGGLRGAIGDWAVSVAALAIVVWCACLELGHGSSTVDLLPAEIALGAIPEGEEREVRMTVMNRGSRTASIVVLPSCICMVPGSPGLGLAPFATATFPIRISTARRPGVNVAHVQIADENGRHLGQSRVTFTAVRSFVIEPPVMFLDAGDASAVADAYCLASETPRELRAAPDDPAVTAIVERKGARRWRVSVALAGRPRTGLASVRLISKGADADETVGTIPVSLPASRVGNVRLSPVGEALPGGRARAWLLVDAETEAEMRLASLRSRAGHALEQHVTHSKTPRGSHLWVEILYPEGAATSLIDVEIRTRSVSERFQAFLPWVPGA